MAKRPSQLLPAMPASVQGLTQAPGQEMQLSPGTLPQSIAFDAQDPWGSLSDLGSISPQWSKFNRMLAAKQARVKGGFGAGPGIAADPNSSFNTNPDVPGN